MPTKQIISEKLQNCFPNGCTRILLINPPVIPEHEFDQNVALNRRYPVFPPYGLGILNRELKQHGYISEILDLNYGIFSHGADFAVWKKLLHQRVNSFRPDVCAITCMYSMTHPSLQAVSDYLKDLNDKIVAIAGGVHPTAAPEVVLTTCRGIDFIMLVEGETSLVALLDHINKKTGAETLRQTATLIDGDIVILDERAVETNIDAPPDFGDLPIGQYHDMGKIGAYHNLLPDDVKASTILSNRGCRGNCTFCSVKAFFGGGGVRMRDIHAVVDEMEFLKQKHGIKHFMWLDDDLLFNEERAIRLFDEITSRNLGITWDASNGVVARSISPAVATSAYKSGCIGLTLGIESGNSEILRSVRKPSGIRHFKRAAQVLNEFPEIFTKGFLMLGFINESVAQIKDTVNLARELALDWYPIQILTPFPGTGFRKQLEEDGLIDPDTVDNKFFLGSTGGQRRREAEEKVDAKDFQDPFTGDLARIPTAEELKDLWFVMDYRVNYEKILGEERPVKLAMLQKMLRDICERVQENPLAALYWGIIEHKLGDTTAAWHLKKLSRQYLHNSDFWRKRFEALDIYRLF